MAKQDKTEMTVEMARYAELDAQEKAIKAEKEKVRGVIISQFTEGGSYEGISYSSRKDIKVKKKEFYEWVSSTWPDILPELLVKEIDAEAFERAYALRKIDYSEIPSHTYTLVNVDVVSIAANRVKK